MCGRMQVDGSCNGLQHYAALGRDHDGAAAVNLVAADKPQVRVHVCACVRVCVRGRAIEARGGKGELEKFMEP